MLHPVYCVPGWCLDSKTKSSGRLSAELTQDKHGQIPLIAVLQNADLRSEEKNGEKLNFRVCLDVSEKCFDERLDLLLMSNMDVKCLIHLHALMLL